MELASNIRAYYDRGGELDRLDAGLGLLEFLRTQDILRRVLPTPEPGSRILDVGGGAGVHARWLAEDGWSVRLIDPVPLHVEHAARVPGVDAAIGDARALDEPESVYTATLLLGPLYHLTDRSERIQALREAGRVTAPGGVVVAATISRFAGLLDSIARNRYWDSTIRANVDELTRTGVLTPLDLFTQAYFHHPDEIVDEFAAAELCDVRRYAVEGAAWLLPDTDGWSGDRERIGILLDALREIERDESLLGASSHLLTIGWVR